jgi:outer membrane protein assembly factor BamB
MKSKSANANLEIPLLAANELCSLVLCSLVLCSLHPLWAPQSCHADEPAQLSAELPRDIRSRTMDSQWHQWRGPLFTGESPTAKPPIEWDETKNVQWKVSLPGRGHSSPIVWDDQIFLTAAIPIGKPFEPIHDDRPGSHDNLPVSQKVQFVVLCVSRATGKEIWQTAVGEAIPHEGGHNSGSLASASATTDGRHVFAFFGSNGLYALDLKGRVAWSKTLGKMHTRHGHGEGTSPLLAEDRLIVNWDHEEQSFIVAYDTLTGDEVWRVDRDEVTTWATPIAVRHNDKTQIVVSGTRRITAYDLSDGKVLWECGGMSRNIVASAVPFDGMVIAGSSYEIQSMLAIKLEGAQGDLTDTRQVVWRRDQRTPYVPSPLLYQGSLYFLRHYQSILTKLDAKTGEEPLGPFRLDGLQNIYASPVAANGHIFIADRSGSTMVIRHGDTPQVVALNVLGDRFNATPAIVGSDIILRGEKYLYRIAEDPK